jgi:SAM-dependent methyltransferase
MAEPLPRFAELFFEVFESLPRQGPGNRACAERALSFCRHLPKAPVVLDLGCGVGVQTLHLAELLPEAAIAALDSHAPSIERLRASVAERGLSARVRPVVGDMAEPPTPPESVDLVWSEGALYNLGLERALQVCRRLLRPGGYLAFTEPVWRDDSPPLEVKAGFEQDYPTMGKLPDALSAVERAGLSLEGHFTLPDAAWWDDFYTPMVRRIEELRGKFAADPEALSVLDLIAAEPEMHRRNSRFYAYEFLVARQPLVNSN